MLRKARTSAPGMASETSSSLFNRCLSPTTTSTELMLRLDSSLQASHACSCLLNSRMVVWADTTNESSSPDSCPFRQVLLPASCWARRTLSQLCFFSLKVTHKVGCSDGQGTNLCCLRYDHGRHLLTEYIQAPFLFLLKSRLGVL